MVAKARFS